MDRQGAKTVLRRLFLEPSLKRGYPTSLAPHLQLQKATNPSTSTRRAPTPRKSRKSLSRPRRDAPPSIRFGRQPARKISNTASTPLAIARPYRIRSSAELRVGRVLICEVERRCGSRCLRPPPKTVRRTLSAMSPPEVVGILPTMQLPTGYYRSLLLLSSWRIKTDRDRDTYGRIHQEDPTSDGDDSAINTLSQLSPNLWLQSRHCSISPRKSAYIALVHQTMPILT